MRLPSLVRSARHCSSPRLALPALADRPTVGRDPFTVSGIEAVADLEPNGPAAFLSGLASSDNVVLAGAVSAAPPAPVQEFGTGELRAAAGGPRRLRRR